MIAGKRVALAGVGYVLTSGIVGMDIDHCIKDGILSDEAQEIIQALATYAEYSPTTDRNGLPTGVHLLMQGFLPSAYRRADNIEVYQDSRYLTVTGAHIVTTPTTLTANQAQLEEVYQKIFSPAAREKEENTGWGDAHRATARFTRHVSDAAVLEKAYRAKNAVNFKRHYEGDYSLWEGKGAKHKSHSEADFELVLLLLYWTNKDISQVDRLFRKSGLMRSKWDRPIKGSETYGERIIKDALSKGR